MPLPSSDVSGDRRVSLDRLPRAAGIYGGRDTSIEPAPVLLERCVTPDGDLKLTTRELKRCRDLLVLVDTNSSATLEANELRAPLAQIAAQPIASPLGLPAWLAYSPPTASSVPM